VRRDAVAAIGALGGPSLSLAVKPLLTDPDAEVRTAAKEASAKLGG
jgi:HEAT repeat protein